MQMADGMDTGPYCAAAITRSLDKNYQELIAEIGQKGARLIVEELENIVSGNVVWTAQDEFCVTYANKIQKGSIDLDASLTAIENLRRIRASSHHERCRSELYGKQVIILAARESTSQQAQTDHKGLFFECCDGPIEITELKPAGKREMTGHAFKAGIRS
jgi:methionyl-tRNA formyltransferase